MNWRPFVKRHRKPIIFGGGVVIIALLYEWLDTIFEWWALPIVGALLGLLLWATHRFGAQRTR